MQSTIMKKTKISFDDYFSELYQERWPSLKQACLNHTQIMRASFDHPVPKTNNNLLSYPIYEPKLHFDASGRCDDGLRPFYIMDAASVICAEQLELRPDDFVLDMCAAPGGKSLILLEKLKAGTLWANEISPNRRQKLKTVIGEYVPKEYRKRVHIKGKDGLKYGLMYPNTFDKILLDAPCSGEKHILNSPKEMEKWSVKRSQRLAKTQYGLLCSALLALKPQGQIVYSTCSISKQENDDVIKRLLDKKAEQVQLDLPQINDEKVERTEFGYIYLPDKSMAGPLYFSRLKKQQSADSI